MSMFLYEKIQALKEAGMTADIPSFLQENLSSGIVLRDYQKEAMHDTLLYLNSNLSQNKQTHLLYYMATGSGKTVIMALDILYYYRLGYRNFLFFTNQTSIVSKTRINFLEKSSSKYLFADSVMIDGKNVKIKEVDTFGESDQDAINLCFQTVQGIHSALNVPREGCLTPEDFSVAKTVLLADEAHHLNSATTKDKAERVSNATWEETVNKIFYANKDNVLLEFTATCDVQDANVREKYLNKIVFNFDLRAFRKAGYTKEFMNLKSNSTKWTRTLQALIVSEYRKLLFEENNVSVQPVVLLKSKTIADSNSFYKEFYERIKKLNVTELEAIRQANKENSLFVHLFSFLDKIRLSSESFLALLKMDFAEEHSVNMNTLSEEKENVVHNLDEKDNRYRLIFAVDKLTEGWDVLSLFDIVRLYETRQGGAGGAVSKYTISEAQLIGRGARYCPFQFEKEQIRDKRKYSDYENPLSICETLLYHCLDDSKYIDEIRRALKQTGLLPENKQIQVTYRLKEEFKNSNVYTKGLVFLNKRAEISRKGVSFLPENICSAGVTYKCGNAASSQFLLADIPSADVVSLKDLPPLRLRDIRYNIVYTAFRRFQKTLAFDVLKRQFPRLKSVREFLTSPFYLGDFPLTFFVTQGYEPSAADMLEACSRAFQTVSDYVQTTEIFFKGTTEFYGQPIREVFTDRVRNITVEPSDDEFWGEGVSQKDSTVDIRYRIDLSDKEWYVYNDNFGTGEEKKFVKYFSTIAEDLKTRFDVVYLIRNELQACIYSFENGMKFQPDYVLILGKNDLYVCTFIEPKGEHLLEKDSWKNTFLLDLNQKGTTVAKSGGGTRYEVKGTPLYNESITKENFISYFTELLESFT